MYYLFCQIFCAPILFEFETVEKYRSLNIHHAKCFMPPISNAENVCTPSKFTRSGMQAKEWTPP